MKPEIVLDTEPKTPAPAENPAVPHGVKTVALLGIGASVGYILWDYGTTKIVEYAGSKAWDQKWTYGGMGAGKLAIALIGGFATYKYVKNEVGRDLLYGLCAGTFVNGVKDFYSLYQIMQSKPPAPAPTPTNGATTGMAGLFSR